MSVHYNSPCESYVFYLILQLNLLNFLNFLNCQSALKIARLTKHDRFYTRGRIIRLDELGQTFVVRPVMRL